MRKSLFRVALAAALACVILAPALLFSGQRPQPPFQNQSVYKGPPVFTVGPPMSPEEQVAREKEKLLSIAEGQWWSDAYAPRIEHRSVPDRASAPLPTTGYKGLTPAELQKLADYTNRPSEFIEYKPGPLDPKKEDRVLRFDAPLRPPGEEGLTPRERAKLEEARAAYGNKAGDEGGRSK